MELKNKIDEQLKSIWNEFLKENDCVLAREIHSRGFLAPKEIQDSPDLLLIIVHCKLSISR